MNIFFSCLLAAWHLCTPSLCLEDFVYFTSQVRRQNLAFSDWTCSQSVGIQRCTYEWKRVKSEAWHRIHYNKDGSSWREGCPAFSAAVAEVSVGGSHAQHWPCELWCSDPTAGAVSWHNSCLQAWFSHCSRDPVSTSNVHQYILFCLINQNGHLCAREDLPDACAVWFCCTLWAVCRTWFSFL